MEQIKAEHIKRLLNEGTPQPSGTSNARGSYAAEVTEQLTRYFAGNPAKPIDEEFDLMVDAWVDALQHSVPERRLGECIADARRERKSSFILEPSDVYSVWLRIKAAERDAMPRVGQYDYRGTEICPHCNNTGTRLIVKRDPLLNRDYAYGAACEVRR